MIGGELFDRIQRKGHFTERGTQYMNMYTFIICTFVYVYTYMCDRSIPLLGTHVMYMYLSPKCLLHALHVHVPPPWNEAFTLSRFLKSCVKPHTGSVCVCVCVCVCVQWNLS